MAEFQHPFVQAATREAFEAKLNAGVISNYQIAFIEDTKEIWARGVYYPCPYSKNELDKFIKDLSDANQEIQENITNIADEEDITLTEEKKLQLKDRDSSKGMGYKILRLPKNGILTQEMINESNTIYEIRYNFDLNGEEITIPNNCTLKFEGGSISNGTLQLVSTIIEGVPSFSLLTLVGTSSSIIIPEWFGEQDDWSQVFNMLLKLRCKVTLRGNKVYTISNPILMGANSSLSGENSSIVKASFKNSQVIKVGPSCEISNIGIESGVSNTVIDIDLDYISENPSDIPLNKDYKNLLNINVNNITINGLLEEQKGSCISLTNKGNGANGWGIKFDGVTLSGRWKYAVYCVTSRPEDSTSPSWLNNISFLNCIFSDLVNGFYFNSLSGAEAPSKINITNCSQQCVQQSNYFIEAISVARLYIRDSEAWDWNQSQNHPSTPVKLTNRCINVTIENLYGSNNYDYERLEEGDDANLYTIVSNNTIAPSYCSSTMSANRIFDILLRDNEVITKDLIRKLPRGIYTVPGEDAYGIKLGGIPSHNGGLLEVSGSDLNRTIVKYYPNLDYPDKKYKEIWIYCSTQKVNASDEALKKEDWIILKTNRVDSIPTYTEVGDFYFNTTINKPVWWDGTEWIDGIGTTVGTSTYGPTASRPTNVPEGFVYFDTDLECQIVWDGTQWINTDGTLVSKVIII